MSSARSDILTAIAATLRGSRPPPDPQAIAEEARRLLDVVPGLRPDRVGVDLVETFRARVTLPTIGATAERVPALADVPEAARRYLTAQGLAARIALQPHPRLQALDWRDVHTHPEVAVDEPAALGIAEWGIAETASLVFHSGPAAPTLFAFLPLHHIVVLEASRILPWLEDYAAALATTPHPRNANLVTGASGTTDIEGALVRGAHGPGFLHVVLVDDLPLTATIDPHP